MLSRPLPEFTGREERAELGPNTNFPTNVIQGPSDTRLEALFQNNVIYQARNPLIVTKDREVAGFFNARLANLREATGGEVTLSATAPFTPSVSGLTFESHFESGNLEMVTEAVPNEFTLLLQNDINTRGHTQWFFFKVMHTTAQHSVTMSIVNFEKSNSLFSHGMKIAIYSIQACTQQGIGWTRGGEEITYSRNGIRRKCRVGFGSYYTLSFKYTFEYSGDEVYFAYSCPYTYTRIQRLLTQFEADSTKNQ